jgi:hypothetical protein
MTRKVVQIAANPDRLYALCDDGEVFRLIGDDTWHHVTPIPQGDPPGIPKPTPGLVTIDEMD